MKKKLSRQSVFENIWRHYIVEGLPYSAEWDEFDYPRPVERTDFGDKSPLALVNEKNLNNHVDKAFLEELQDSHDKAVEFVFDNVKNVNNIKNLYARDYLRVFRKTMKYFLIHFGIEYGLTIPSERAITPLDLKLAAKNKR